MTGRALPVWMGRMDTHDHVSPADAPAWAVELAARLRRVGGVGAMSIDPAGRRIRIATIGPVDEAILRAELAETLRLIAGAGAMRSAPTGLVGGVRFGREGAGIRLENPTCRTEPSLWRWREIPWPGGDAPPGAAGAAHDPDAHEDEDWRVLACFAAACAVLQLAAFLTGRFAPDQLLLVKILYGAAVVAGGWDAFKDSLENIPKGRLDIHFLMLVVAIGACAIGAWGEGALLLFLFSGAGALEHFAMHRTRREIDALFKATPKTARVVVDSGEESEVPVESVVVGARVRVRPGDTFPLDGEVLSGETASDESTLTGEARPVSKLAGDTVFGGTLNLWGAVLVRVTKPVSESSLQKIIRLIRDAQHAKAPSQRFTDRFGTTYSIGILLLTLAAFLVWWLAMGVAPFASSAEGGSSAFYRAMTLLVVSSPCALVLSIPSAILAAIAWGARRGILFKGGAAIEKLAEIDCVCLDKTGTLTTGDLTVERVESFPGGNEDAVLRLAVSLEANANHPLARAIVAHGKRNGVVVDTVESFESMTGRGVRGSVAGAQVALGRRELLAAGPLSGWAEELPAPPAEFAEVWVIAEGVLGRILLRDQIRRESKPVMDALAAGGIRTVMLTGDRSEAAVEIGRRIGLAEVQGGLTPEGKVGYIRALENAGHRVAMVGDGVNDAPALATAHVAVAMGARGSDAALEQADIVLMDDRIDRFLDARRLSLRARRIIRQNLAISLGTIGVMVTVTLFKGVPLSLGVFAHEGSTMLVCLNSMRLLFGKAGRA